MTIREKLQTKIFRDTAKLLEKHGIPYWLESDTLLNVMGAKQNLELSQNRHIEIGIPGEYLNHFLGLRKQFFPLYRFYEYSDRSGRRWIDGDFCKIGILNSWRKAKTAFKVLITIKYKKNGKYRWVDTRSCKWVSSCFFDSLDEISVDGVAYPIPADVENYLEQRYGDWRNLKSHWVSSIDDLSIVEEPIIKRVPPKKVILRAPTEKIELHQHNYHQEMKNMLLYTIDILQDYKIPHWLEAGTLLGIIRDGDLIPWDYDADLAIPSEYGPKVLDMWYKFLPKYLVRKGTTTSLWLPSNLRVVKIKTPWAKLKRLNFHVDLFCVYRKSDIYRWIDSNALKHIDKKYYETLDTIRWEGREISIPSHVEDYLTTRYGNWRKPDENFDSSLHDGAIAEKGF